MTGKLLLAAVGVALVSQPVAADTKPDYAALAEKLVGTAANVKEGEIVEISAGPNDLALAEEMAVAVRKRGGYPIITYWSETASKKAIAAVPEKYDAQAPKLDLALVKLFDVRIVLPAVRDPNIFNALSPERRAKMGKVDAQVIAASQKNKKLRMVEVDNGVAPSPERAKMYGVSDADLQKAFWDGIGADYTAVAAKCKAVQDQLVKANEVRITAPNGTDFKFKVKGGKVGVSDGVMSDDKTKSGNARIWLPAGEVYIPVKPNGEGKLVDDRIIQSGKELTGVTAEIKGGKITNISAKTGWDAIKPLYDAAEASKDQVSAFDIGCNPAFKNVGKMEAWAPAGTVTVTTGFNGWAGGNITNPFGFTFQLSNATVTFDGKTVVENGALK
jgi:leucyl aminopeptidase (aminopeptidase T)